MQNQNNEAEARNGIPLPTYQPLFGVVSPEASNPNKKEAEATDSANAVATLDQSTDTTSVTPASESLANTPAKEQNLDSDSSAVVPSNPEAHASANSAALDFAELVATPRDEIDILMETEFFSELKQSVQISKAYDAELAAKSGVSKTPALDLQPEHGQKSLSELLGEDLEEAIANKIAQEEKVFVNPALPTLADEAQEANEEEVANSSKSEEKSDSQETAQANKEKNIEELKASLINIDEVDPTSLSEEQIIAEIKKIGEIAYLSDNFSAAEKDILKQIIGELESLPPIEEEKEEVLDSASAQNLLVTQAESGAAQPEPSPVTESSLEPATTEIPASADPVVSTAELVFPISEPQVVADSSQPNPESTAEQTEAVTATEAKDAIAETSSEIEANSAVESEYNHSLGFPEFTEYADLDSDSEEDFAEDAEGSDEQGAPREQLSFEELRERHLQNLAKMQEEVNLPDNEYVMRTVFVNSYPYDAPAEIRDSVEQKLAETKIVSELVLDSGEKVRVRQLSAEVLATLNIFEVKYAILKYADEFLTALMQLKEAAQNEDSQVISMLEFLSVSNLGRLDDTFNRFKGTEAQFYKDLYLQCKMFCYIEAAKLVEQGYAILEAKVQAFEKFEDTIIAHSKHYKAIDFLRDLEVLLDNSEIYQDDAEFKIYIEAYQESLSLLESLGDKGELNYFDSLISGIYAAKLSSRQI